MWAHSAIVIVLAALTATPAAQAPPDIETLLARVGGRIAEYYRRAQNVICLEKSTVQPVGRDFTPAGFGRVTEYELHVEMDANADGDALPDATVVRELLRVNGRAPREKDKKDRAGCTDPNPLSPEPLAFLMPAHRADYKFVSSGLGKGKDSHTLIIEFTSPKPTTKGELAEHPQGIPDCFTTSLAVVTKGRVWVNATTYDVVRIEERIAGPADLDVPVKMQTKYHFDNMLVMERHDTTIRYKTVPFHDPDEAMLLPESIDTLVVWRGGLESTRHRQVFSDYRRFITGGRVVK